MTELFAFICILCACFIIGTFVLVVLATAFLVVLVVIQLILLVFEFFRGAL